MASHNNERKEPLNEEFKMNVNAPLPQPEPLPFNNNWIVFPPLPQEEYKQPAQYEHKSDFASSQPAPYGMNPFGNNRNVPASSRNLFGSRKAGGFNLLPVKGYPRNPRGLDYELQAETKASGGFVDDNDLMESVKSLYEDYKKSPGWTAFLNGLNAKRRSSGGQLSYNALNNLINKYLKVDVDAVKHGGMMTKKADGGYVHFTNNVELNTLINQILFRFRDHPRLLEFVNSLNGNLTYENIARTARDFFEWDPLPRRLER